MSIPCLSILMSTPDSRLWRAGQWLRSSEVRRQAESCFSNFQASGKLSKRAEIQKQLWPRNQNNKKNVPHESIWWSGCLCLLLPKQSRINKWLERFQKLLSWKTIKVTMMSPPALYISRIIDFLVSRSRFSAATLQLKPKAQFQVLKLKFKS